MSIPGFRSSPRTRGCFCKPSWRKRRSRSSPRTRGCFFSCQEFFLLLFVFPAHAGVFPSLHRLNRLGSGLPRARGGVSDWKPSRQPENWSSPRTRGCFQLHRLCRRWNGVFPAHAGVFLPYTESETETDSLPRARGGVSKFTGFVQRHQLSSPRTRGCF